jgi:sortase A
VAAAWPSSTRAPGTCRARSGPGSWVIGKKWVAPTDTAVLDPVPSHPRQRPTRRLITLITCDPAWTGTHRVIVTGVLVAAKPR